MPPLRRLVRSARLLVVVLFHVSEAILSPPVDRRGSAWFGPGNSLPWPKPKTQIGIHGEQFPAGVYHVDWAVIPGRPRGLRANQTRPEGTFYPVDSLQENENRKGKRPVHLCKSRRGDWLWYVCPRWNSSYAQLLACASRLRASSFEMWLMHKLLWK